MNFGIISTHWMCEKFCDAINMRSDSKVTGVYSRDLSRAKDFAYKYDIDGFYDNYDMMLENDDIDAIYVASPNFLHFEHSLKALENKKHVLIEKPITINVEQLEKLRAVAIKNGVFFLEAYKPLHLKEFAILKEEVKKLKNISYANFIQLQYSSKYEAFLKGEIASTFDANYGGALYDIGIYPLYYPIVLFGKPISYTYNQFILENGVDGTGTISLTYENFIVDISYSKIVDGVNESYIYDKDNIIKMGHVSNLKSVYLNDKCLIEDNSENKMHGEIDSFIKMVESKDLDSFEYYYNLSFEVIKIIEEVRGNVEII